MYNLFLLIFFHVEYLFIYIYIILFIPNIYYYSIYSLIFIYFKYSFTNFFFFDIFFILKYIGKTTRIATLFNINF